MQRRRVRITDGFFEQLDDQLDPDRGPNGEPSSTDFIALELPAVIERFATDFTGLPEIVEGVPAGRMLIAPGVLVGAVVVYGLLVDEETVELIGISIE